MTNPYHKYLMKFTWVKTKTIWQNFEIIRDDYKKIL